MKSWHPEFCVVLTNLVSMISIMFEYRVLRESGSQFSILRDVCRA